MRLTDHDVESGKAGMSKELSSKWTLCSPPPLVQVTVSPGATVTSAGVKTLSLATTVWLAAPAGTAGSTKSKRSAIRGISETEAFEPGPIAGPGRERVFRA